MKNRFVINADASTWLVQGLSEIMPTDGSTYFRAIASKYGDNNGEEEMGLGCAKSAFEARVISVCIPCFTEESSSLERTLKSLQSQELPSGVVCEILIVMDGIEKMSQSMRAYVDSLFGLSLYDDEQPLNQNNNIFQQLPEAETIVVESFNNKSHNQDKHEDGRGGMSLILKRNNRRKVNSHMWWLAGHANDTSCEFALATDCGIVFEKTAIAQMLSRLDQDQRLAAVTGFQRVMTATMQGDGTAEWLKDPVGHVLRQIQRFDFEV